MIEQMNLEQATDLLATLEAKSTPLKSVKGMYTQLADCKTFAMAVEVVTAIIAELNVPVTESVESNTLDIAEENHKVAELEAESMKSLREQVKTEVLRLLTVQASSTFDIAKQLVEVKEDFDKADDFLAWCKAELGLAKASVYNYLKLDKTFGSKPEFAGVAVRVLNELSRYKYLPDIIDDAEIMATNKTLDSKSLHTLIDGNELKRNPKPVTQPTPPVKDEPTQTTTGIPDTLPTNEEDDEEPPFDGDVIKVTMPSVPTKQDVEGDEGPTELELMAKQLEALTEQLAKANETIAELTGKTERNIKQASAPSLPQFKNACLYARLGLGQVESKDSKIVRGAFRELVKLGYGIDHKDYGLIKFALDELTK